MKTYIIIFAIISSQAYASSTALKDYSRALEILFKVRSKNIINVSALKDSLNKAEAIQKTLPSSGEIDISMKNRYNAEALYIMYLITSLEQPGNPDSSATLLSLSYKSIVKSLKTYNQEYSSLYKKAKNLEADIRSFMSDIENVALNNQIFLPADLMLVDRLSIPELPANIPQYSSRLMIDNELLRAEDANVTLSFVDKKISGVLKKCGYDEFSYFSFGSFGYAIITKIERINDDGSYVSEDIRWNINQGVINAFSFIDIVKAIFFATPARYRFMIFLVTPDGIIQSSTPPKPALYKEGIDRLPERIGALPYTEQYRCSILVYEFVRPDVQDANVNFISNPSISAKAHLTKSNILELFSNSHDWV